MNSKIYRCGWCGNPVNEKGECIYGETWQRVVNIIETPGSDAHTHLKEGECCIQENFKEERRRVTRDMAIDAGDLSLEGQIV